VVSRGSGRIAPRAPPPRRRGWRRSSTLVRAARVVTAGDGRLVAHRARVLTRGGVATSAAGSPHRRTRTVCWHGWCSCSRP
jgi:hypothetical protein